MFYSWIDNQIESCDSQVSKSTIFPQKSAFLLKLRPISNCLFLSPKKQPKTCTEGLSSSRQSDAALVRFCELNAAVWSLFMWPKKAPWFWGGSQSSFRKRTDSSAFWKCPPQAKSHHSIVIYVEKMIKNTKIYLKSRLMLVAAIRHLNFVRNSKIPRCRRD